MAVVSMMRMAGNPDELAERVRAAGIEELTERLGPSHGWLGTVVARDGTDGVLIVNLWENEEGRHAMAAEPEIQQAMGNAGLPIPAFEGYEVISMNLKQPAFH
jgi:hypothetical protein